MAATTTTPKELSERLEVNAKTLRAFLRKEFPRDAEQKNSRWEIPAKAVKAAEAHFSQEDKNEEKAS